MTDSIDLSPESLAPSTELSHQLPPIPPVPPIPNSPSPIAPPPPPSKIPPSSNIAAGRQILQPVSPSKRQIPERLPNNKINSNIANAFIPQELAEIIATRQRRERAWHARLITCTTAISNLDSTLANFTEEIEIEEAAALKSYLRQAVANFAAADSLTSPPCVPSHTRPNKANGKGKDKDLNTKTNTTKKVAVATPKNIPSQSSDRASIKEAEQIRVMPTTKNSWATVARNGQKTTRVTQSACNLQAALVNKAIPNMTNKSKSSPRASPSLSTADTRLFVRLPQDHEWRKLSPAGICEPVHSGFALSPCNSEAREEVLKAGNGLFMSGAKLEAATSWVSVLVPTVPASVHMEQGVVDVSKSMLADEIERVCSVRPAHLKLYGRNKSEAPHRTWMAYFPKAPRAGFRVFDESGIVRLYKKQNPLEFCKRCNGHHPAKNYSRAPSCANCGSTNHSVDTCMAATKCRNCGGPHRADSRRCLARPNHSGRARIAEENAATTGRIDIDLTSSQILGDISTPENSQATNVEAYGGENVRPRAVTYIRKDPNRLSSLQKFPLSPTGDYCWVEVNSVMFLNVYKAPHNPTAVQQLLSWTLTSRTVAIGDFNSVYWAWQPTANTFYGQGEEIEKWAEEHNLTCLIIGEPTHRLEAMAWVCREECMTSDHLPIRGFIPNPREASVTLPDVNTNLRISKTNIPQFGRVMSQWLPSITCLNTLEEIDNFAREICWALENALKTTGKRLNEKSGRSAPWWTPECKFAHLEYRDAVQESKRIKKAKTLRNTVASAKREHWKKKIEDSKSSKDAFKLMRWAAP
ncbi:hypothetical protein EPUL_003942 [Erysiphe pulchra]|uniref:Endonuclease/exonuclease/phosphatase domain-containing protein n=1 Tax=Erysiphe pulchra TaxID=225359 RepID=A0A2S4PKY2_9PEZI|nr:hypothetical protein EPUL_003942 [Erysiphe pulchra]